MTRAVPGVGNLGTTNQVNATVIAHAATVAAAANTTIAAAISVTINSRNLPPDVCNRCDSFNNPTQIMTQSAMVAFVQPTSGCGPVLSYLDPPIGTGVMPSPTDSNRIITWNGQFPL